VLAQFFKPIIGNQEWFKTLANCGKRSPGSFVRQEGSSPLKLSRIVNERKNALSLTERIKVKKSVHSIT